MVVASRCGLAILATLAAGLAVAPRAAAQGTAFTYQGRLDDGGAPANGSYDLQFILYNASAGGSQAGPILTNSATEVSNGLFTVALDFGAGLFTGSKYWLDISVRTNGGGSFTELSPRQELTPAPYAIFAEGTSNVLGVVPSGGLSGVYSGAVTFNNGSDSFSGSFTGNGGGVSNVNALTLNGLGAGNFWQTTGNAGTTPGVNFVGTTDNQPLELHVNGQRALRLEPNASGVPNVIGGANNTVTAGTVRATIGGGELNTVSGPGATVGGGYDNNNSGVFAVIGGGYGNTASGPEATVGGGTDNKAGPEDATVAGGVFNQAIGAGAFVGGGGFDGTNFAGNTASGAASTVGGGYGNSATNAYATVGGGNGNRASGSDSTVGGGYGNSAGNLNIPYATIGGGYNNIASGEYATVGGGYQNTASGTGAFVGAGGYDGINFSPGNTASGGGSVVVGGLYNAASGSEATVGGGYNNTAGGFDATVPGGALNSAGGSYSFAAGKFAGAKDNNSFVWSDGENTAYYYSDRANQFTIQAGGGVVLDVSGSSGLNPAALRVNSTSGNGVGIFVAQNSSDATAVFTADGTGDIIKGFSGATGGNLVFEVVNNGTVYSKGLALTSDRRAKANFASVNPERVLAKVAALPISEWNFKTDPAGLKHLGPMAQDFHAAFGLDGTDDTHISVVDEGGVALAAIQGLNEKLKEETKKKDAEIRELRQSVVELKEMVSRLTPSQTK